MSGHCSGGAGPCLVWLTVISLQHNLGRCQLTLMVPGYLG